MTDRTAGRAVRPAEVNCPRCSNVVALNMGRAITFMGHGQRWYGLRRILLVTCERCGTTWMPSIAGGKARMGKEERADLVAGLTEIQPFVFYRDVFCPTPACAAEGKVLGQASVAPAGGEGPALLAALAARIGADCSIPYAHFKIEHGGRVAYARRLTYVECDWCRAGFDAETAGDGVVTLAPV